MGSKVTLHMVQSLDGFIAKKNGDVSWMHSDMNYESGVVLTKDMIESFLAKIDCYVIGSKTYEHAMKLGWVYGDKPVVVVSSRTLHTERESVSFYSGDLEELFRELKLKYNNIWVGGGAEITKSLLQTDLVDELVVTIAPIILGDGILFFDYIKKEQKLKLKNTTAYNDGMVELTYTID